MEQEYAKVPGSSNFTENDWLPDSGGDGLIPDAFVNVTVCGTASLFTQRTIAPALTVRLEGLNAIFWILIVLSDTVGVVSFGTNAGVVTGNVVTGGAVVATGDWAGCTGWDSGCEHPLTTSSSTIHAENRTTRFITR